VAAEQLGIEARAATRAEADRDGDLLAFVELGDGILAERRAGGAEREAACKQACGEPR
jgi:hypothetical protein